MTKDERDRIREAEREYHDSVEVLGWAKEPELQDIFLHKANRAAFTFKALLRVRKNQRDARK